MKTKRVLLKGITLALPAAWIAPKIHSTILPAHATTSEITYTFDCVANPPDGGLLPINSIGEFSFRVTPNPGPLDVDVEISCNGTIINTFIDTLNTEGRIEEFFEDLCGVGQTQVFQWTLPNGQFGRCSWIISPPTVGITDDSIQNSDKSGSLYTRD